MTGKQKIRFTLCMAGLACVILLLYSWDVLGYILAPFTFLTVKMTLSLLHLSGMEVALVAITQIHHPNGFAYEIYYRCTAFLPLAIFSVSILAYPGAMTNKLLGLSLGLPLLLGLNLFRLVSLFYIGVYIPKAFGLTHSVIWEILMVVATIGLWLSWIKWIHRDSKEHELLES